MKRHLIATLAFGLAHIGQANAAWDFTPDTDPMTDEKTAYVSVDDADNSYAIGFKCWDDAEKTRWIAFLTDIDFDKATSYPKSIEITVRIDKERPMEIGFRQENLGNELAYVTLPDVGQMYFNLEKSLLKAKSRIATEFMGIQIVFSVPNTQDVMEKMSTICPYLGK